MNKQIIVATFLGTTSAQGAVAVICEDAFVKQAQDEKIALDAKKASLATEKTTLAGLAGSELTAYNTAKARYDAQVTLMAPFVTKRDAAKAAQGKKTTDSAAATTKITAIDTEITTRGTALTTAEAAVTSHNVKITAQAGVMTKLNFAVTEHTTEKALMQTALTSATTAADTAKTELTTATTAKTAFITARALTTAPKGTGKLLIDTTATAGTALTAFNTATTEFTTADNEYKAALMAFDLDTRKKADYLAVCVQAGLSVDCTGWSNSPMRTLYDAPKNSLTGTTTTKGTKLSAWNTKVTALATAQDNKNQADIAKEVATTNDNVSAGTLTTLTSTETTKTGAKTTADAAKTTAQTNFDTASGQLTQATTDQTRGNAVLTKLNTELIPLSDAVVVAKYLKKIKDDEKAIQVTAKAAADKNLANFTAIMNMAEETVTRAKKKLDFEDGLTKVAKASKKVIDLKVAANGTAITANGNAIIANAAKIAKRIATCKGIGYDKAQTAMKDLLAKTKADAAQAATVKTAYDAKAAFATTGETNTDCAYPKEAGKPRPVCKEGYCCGAAQKFMRDGSKLAVETCQKNKDVHTYTFYPPLPANAIVEPTPETWRFQCISGAKQLVATATAALAATYMMA